MGTIAIDLICDATSVIAGGSQCPEISSVRTKIHRIDGPCTIIGSAYTAPVRDALLMNATAISVLQLQDGYSNAKGHPAAQLFAVLFATAEACSATPKDFLAAFVGGYEVAARVGVALGGVPDHLHDIGNWVTLGAAAGAASLLSARDPDVIAAAIDGAASMALAFDRRTTTAGATMHYLYAGLALVTALSVAEAAWAGWSALPGSLEDFYGHHFGKNFDPTAVCRDVGISGWDDYLIADGYIKLHPSCAHLHGINDAVALLVTEEHLREADVDHVQVATFDEAIRVDAHQPHNELAARFSVSATVAATLRYGRLSDDGLRDLTVLEPLMRRISVTHDPDLDRYKPSGRAGRVRVTLKNGRVVSRTVIHPRGTPEVPATRAETSEKTGRLLSRAYGIPGATQICSAITGLPTAASLDRLVCTLRGYEPSG